MVHAVFDTIELLWSGQRDDSSGMSFHRPVDRFMSNDESQCVCAWMCLWEGSSVKQHVIVFWAKKFSEPVNKAKQARKSRKEPPEVDVSQLDFDFKAVIKTIFILFAMFSLS